MFTLFVHQGSWVVNDLLSMTDNYIGHPLIRPVRFHKITQRTFLMWPGKLLRGKLLGVVGEFNHEHHCCSERLCALPLSHHLVGDAFCSLTAIQFAMWWCEKWRV